MTAQDLTQVRGVGPARAAWLRYRFGIEGLTDLAASDPAEVERALREDGHRIRPGEVTNWVTAAVQLVGPAGHTGWVQSGTFVVSVLNRDEEQQVIVSDDASGQSVTLAQLDGTLIERFIRSVLGEQPNGERNEQET